MMFFSPILDRGTLPFDALYVSSLQSFSRHCLDSVLWCFCCRHCLCFGRNTRRAGPNVCGSEETSVLETMEDKIMDKFTKKNTLQKVQTPN